MPAKASLSGGGIGREAIVKYPLFFLFLIVLLTASPAWGHGTEGMLSKKTGILITAAYDDGEPMSYAEVEITGPDSTVPFQKGRTDRNGNFMFRPDVSGRWHVVVNDGIGHRLALEYQEEDNKDLDKNGNTVENPAGPQATAAPRFPRMWGAVTGLSIIFGLCSCLWAWKRKCYNR